MALSILNNGDSDRVTLQAVNLLGEGSTGQTINLVIQNAATGQYFNGAAFQAGFVSVTMSEIDATNLPGVYEYVFACPLVDVRVSYWAFPQGNEIKNGPFQGEAQFGEWVEEIETARKYVRNKIVVSGNRYTLYEDDKATVFEQGDIQVSGREPD